MLRRMVGWESVAAPNRRRAGPSHRPRSWQDEVNSRLIRPSSIVALPVRGRLGPSCSIASQRRADAARVQVRPGNGCLLTDLRILPMPVVGEGQVGAPMVADVHRGAGIGRAPPAHAGRHEPFAGPDRLPASRARAMAGLPPGRSRVRAGRAADQLDQRAPASGARAYMTAPGKVEARFRASRVSASASAASGAMPARPSSAT